MGAAAEVIVRPYQPEDRQMVRDVCYATGYMGDSPDCYWRDVESFADLWSRYYTDREPESVFVAARPDGVVVGYLLGCVDTTKANDFNRILRQHFVKDGAPVLVPGMRRREGGRMHVQRLVRDLL